jgi:hypothetical protein
MDQGVIVTCKRSYKKKFLEVVMVVLEETEDAEEDTRGTRTPQNLHAYNIRSAIFNLAAAWKDMKITTLANAWKKLLYDVEPEMDFEGVEASNFRDSLLTAGNKIATENDVEQWLENDEGNPGYQIFSEGRHCGKCSSWRKRGP